MELWHFPIICAGPSPGSETSRNGVYQDRSGCWTIGLLSPAIRCVGGEGSFPERRLLQPPTHLIAGDNSYQMRGRRGQFSGTPPLAAADSNDAAPTAYQPTFFFCGDQRDRKSTRLNSSHL